MSRSVVESGTRVSITTAALYGMFLDGEKCSGVTRLVAAAVGGSVGVLAAGVLASNVIEAWVSGAAPRPVWVDCDSISQVLSLLCRVRTPR